jgi:transposase InsO family protein
MNWNYICVLIDLFNREIIGFSAGKNKDAALVKRAFQSIKSGLQDIQIFPVIKFIFYKYIYL